MLLFTVLAAARCALAIYGAPFDEPGHSELLTNSFLKDMAMNREVVRMAKLEKRKMCIIRANKKELKDDAPRIMKALNGKCRTKSIVYLPDCVYNIMSNMTTMYLNDVKIIQMGRLLWSPDIDYWRSVAMPIGFQNQTTVWYFGGDRVIWDGYGHGTLDGNGQVWYDWARSEGNLPGRPCNINLRRLSNSVIRNMRFVQSQMWTMAITNSRGIELTDIYVNSTSNSQWSTLNTDGCDTINSDHIIFRRWFVQNGDDAIALKRNSSHIYVHDSVFKGGQGLAMGSVGQYDGKYDYISDFYARNLTFIDTAHVSYLKTWAGVSRGYPPNGGGGGLGRADNINITDVKVEKLRQQPFFAWQCENYSGWAGKDCNSSKFKMSNVRWRNVTGTVKKGVKDIGWFQCSAAAGGCDNFEVADIRITVDGESKRDKLDKWHCENMNKHKGFTCNDPRRPKESK
ncbi:Pectin lyase fold protein [Metarhizium album ARSEF 1941]|uniref:Pectin lyase fold protein n=1 Tax=Metarhizium album (strain ARSEF 1941) TaxID=1081103 RepID=A0A0B2WTC0_METAS|nr:Pectin lyase fold protein [Metarhizium album ARSEF 1941]KHN97248.1 Pectin lyase fold protein [Metarhizium album ARSEF 1941]